MTFDPLREQLRLLAAELQKDDIKLILGGGYGLVLRTEYVRRTQAATRFEEIPEARSTNDLDLFYRKNKRRSRNIKIRAGCSVLSISA
jgi:hypothetical protein